MSYQPRDLIDILLDCLDVSAASASEKRVRRSSAAREASPLTLEMRHLIGANLILSSTSLRTGHHGLIRLFFKSKPFETLSGQFPTPTPGMWVMSNRVAFNKRHDSNFPLRYVEAASELQYGGLLGGSKAGEFELDFRLMPIAKDICPSYLRSTRELRDPFAEEILLPMFDVQGSRWPLQDVEFHRGVVLSDANKHDSASEAFARAAACVSDFAEAHFRRGQCLEALNRSREAFEEYKSAVAADARHGNALEALARLGVTP